MAGKILSKKNQNTIVESFQALGTLLKISGSSDEELLDLLGIDSEDEEEDEEDILARSIEEQVKDATWREGFHKINEILRENFSSGYFCKDTTEQAQNYLRELLQAVESGVLDLIQRLPEPNREEEVYIWAHSAPQEVELQAQSLKEDFRQRLWEQKVDCAIACFTSAVWRIVFYREGSELDNKTREEVVRNFWTELKEILNECIVELPYQVHPLVAKSASLEGRQKAEKESVIPEKDSAIPEENSDWQIATPVEFAEPIQAGGELEHPFSGVLLTLDEPSEAAPFIGPSTPIIVPTKVGVELSRSICAAGVLPLDVHPDFSDHCPENITGFITSSEVVGGEVLVHGKLCSHNKPEVVAAIQANKESLGMSLDGIIRYNPGILGEQPVAVATKIVAKGASILYKAKATWRKTKIIQANAKENKMADNQELLQNIKNLFDQSVGEIKQEVSGLGDRVTQIETNIQAQAQKLQTWEKEKQEQEDRIQAAKQQEAEAQRNMGLVDALKQAIKEELVPVVEQTANQQVKRAINPRLAPAPMSQTGVPLVASANTPVINQELYNLQLQEKELEGQIKAMASNHHSGATSTRIKLQDDLRSLKSKIQQLQLVGV